MRRLTRALGAIGMTDYKKLLQGIRTLSPFLAWSEQGLTPEEIKAEIVRILAPYFENTAFASELPIEMLAHEAVAVEKISRDPWSSAHFSNLLSLYQQARALDRGRCIQVLAEWNESIFRSMAEFTSLYLLEADHENLSLEEFKVEMFRNIGGVIEACIQPQLKALLHQVHICTGRFSSVSELTQTRLGSIVNELYAIPSLSTLVAPPPWGLQLNQWRNIAQHHSATVVGDSIECRYSIGTLQQVLILNRQDLLSLARKIQEILGILRAARSLFIANNLEAFLKDLPSKTSARKEVSFFVLSVGIATQGFEVVGLNASHDNVFLTVQDVTKQDPLHRGIHASQLLYSIWQIFRTPKVVVSYRTREGTPFLQATAEAADLEQLESGQLGIDEFANRVQFQRMKKDTK